MGSATPLADKDRIFTNLYGFQEPWLKAARARGEAKRDQSPVEQSAEQRGAARRGGKLRRDAAKNQRLFGGEFLRGEGTLLGESDQPLERIESLVHRQWSCCRPRSLRLGLGFRLECRRGRDDGELRRTRVTRLH